MRSLPVANVYLGPATYTYQDQDQDRGSYSVQFYFQVQQKYIMFQYILAINKL